MIEAIRGFLIATLAIVAIPSITFGATFSVIRTNNGWSPQNDVPFCHLRMLGDVERGDTERMPVSLVPAQLFAT